MATKSVCVDYLRAFQAVHKGASSIGATSIEMASRPVVHSFVEEIVRQNAPSGKSILVHHDSSYDRSNRPDWRIDDELNFGVFCFGDHKNLNLTGPFTLSAKEQQQIDRYLELGRPVFVFDGIEFLFFSEKGCSPERRCIVSKASLTGLSDWSTAEIDLAFATEFRKLLHNPGFRKWSELDLIQQLALRARALVTEIEQLLHAPAGSGFSAEEEQLITALAKLKAVVADHHDESLRNERACAVFVSQVLTFGLFYAHTRNESGNSSPTERERAIGEFWTSSDYSSQANELRPFKAIVDVLGDVLSRNNVVGFWFKDLLSLLAHAEMMGVAPSDRDFHTLFEKFLEKFDNSLRYDRGAFYTPMPLSRWMTLSVDEISLHTFGLRLRDLDTKIIDPCCGTGTFLESFCTELGPFSDSSPTLTGLEILPAPYALANYRLTPIAQQTKDALRLKILLTDTLSDHFATGSSAASDFAAELNEARDRCLDHVTLVIGNPPSTGVTAASPRVRIEAALDDFRPPPSERGARQNVQKALNNEAFRFLRWGADRVLESPKGILALVLPGAFSHAVSFRFARKWLIERFDEIFVLELDADARTGEATQSLFAVQQGRLVLFAVSTQSSATDQHAKVHHLDLTGRSLAEKLEFFKKNFDRAAFSEITNNPDAAMFRPLAQYPPTLWKACWPLTKAADSPGIFASKCSALKLSPISALFHTQKAILLRRSTDLGRITKQPQIQAFVAKWFKGQTKPPAQEKFSASVRGAIATAAKHSRLKPYTFRPFVHGYVVDDETVYLELTKVPGGGMRSRPEVRASFDAGAVALAVAPSPVDIGSTLTRFAAFVDSYPDNDIAARGNAMIYPSVAVKKGSTNGKSASNVTPEATQVIDSQAANVVFYVYAIISSLAYRDTFEGALFRSADPASPPRVPVFSDQQVRSELIGLGKRLAACERPGYVSPTGTAALVSPELFKPFFLKTYAYDAIGREIVLKSESGDEARVGPVSASTYETEIAGHNVVEKWLRERTERYLRREITLDDLGELAGIVNALVEQEAIIASIDSVLTSNLLIGSLIHS